jgi:hypothetical protein
MKFEIRNHGDDVADFHWRLVKADGSPVANGPSTFASEAETRSDIATFKKAASGVRFAKTVVVDA